MKNAIIIFLKNPGLGKVKTRLAATIGNESALNIYLELINHTLTEAYKVEADLHLYFSEEADNSFINTAGNSTGHIQHGNNLGERMLNAFAATINKAYKKTIIIGTDCPGLDSSTLLQAFDKLDTTDIVFGPAQDGGYYLLGMKKLHTPLFFNIKWSTSDVLKSSLAICRQEQLSVSQLKELSDVDTENDMVHLKLLISRKTV
jgi:uncharacterized protein